MKIYVIHEHADSLTTLASELDRLGVAWDEWYVNQGAIDPDAVPPPGVYFNRMSPGAHTRGHLHSVTHTRELLAWLEAHNRPLINATRSFELQISRSRQQLALRAAGLRTPRSVSVVGGREAVFHAARGFPLPLLIKPGRGTAGRGVRLLTSLESLYDHIADPDFTPGPDDVTVLQEYVRPREPFLTRVQFIAGELTFAARVPLTDAPADSQVEILPTLDDPIVYRYRAFFRAHEVDVGTLDFITGVDGLKYTVDVSTLGDQDRAIESRLAVPTDRRIAGLLERALRTEQRRQAVRDRRVLPALPPLQDAPLPGRDAQPTADAIGVRTHDTHARALSVA